MSFAYLLPTAKMHITVILRCMAVKYASSTEHSCSPDLGSKTTYLHISPTSMSTISWWMYPCYLYTHRRLLPWPAARAERTFITSPSYISPRCQYPSGSPPKLGIPDSGSGESLKRASVTSPVERAIRRALYSPANPYICVACSIPTKAKAAAAPPIRKFTIDSKPPLPPARLLHHPFLLPIPITSHSHFLIKPRLLTRRRRSWTISCTAARIPDLWRVVGGSRSYHHGLESGYI